jgi:HEPN domain-containing protein
MDDSWDPARDWLIKAENDLASARLLASAAQPLRDTAIYHCQQAGEKALKALLAWKKRPLLRTHDLEILLNQVVADCPGLEQLQGPAESLTPYAVEYRYPGEFADPSEEELDEALAAAQAILLAVSKLVK